MKTIQFRTLLAVVAALAVAAWITSQRAQGAQQGQQTPKGERIVSNSQGWIYLVDPMPLFEDYDTLDTTIIIQSKRKRNAERFQRQIDQRAAEGWEFVNMGYMCFFFKRPK